MIYLGVDCGTQSTKTIALDGEDGRILAQASRKYDVIGGLPPGHMEQEPSTWAEVMEATVGEVAGALGGRAKEVRGIGVSGQQHGFVALDARGESIRPAKLWCDTSTAEECEILRRELGGAAGVIEKVGVDMLPGFTAPKILWLKRHEPEHFRRLVHVLLPHDYLNYRLTGAFTMEYGDASGTALLDVRKRVWCREVVEAVDGALSSKLPEVRSSAVPAGRLRPELARRWGLGDGVVVSAGGGDNMMGAIGTGNCRPGRVTASLGTSGTIYAYADRPVVDPEGEIAAFCDSTDGWLPLLCTMNVTVATEAVRGMFGWPVHELDDWVAKAPPGADGLLFLPYLQGERTPNLPRGCGVFHGLTTRNFTPAHLVRAVMEGVTLGLAYGLRRLEELGVASREIRLIGGGSNSSVWRQLCADVFGRRVVTLQSAEGAALGAAIQALAAAQPEKPVAAWADELARLDESRACEPRASGGFDYRAQLDRQTKLMRSLAGAGYL